jgi:hypothetical protein
MKGISINDLLREKNQENYCIPLQAKIILRAARGSEAARRIIYFLDFIHNIWSEY